jgi:hypothetical protein
VTDERGHTGGPGVEIVSPEEKLATALGWASLGLGAAMVAAPGRLNRLAGIRDERSTRAWQRIVGVRELAAFAVIVVGGQRRAGLWARAAGDGKDLALLAVAAGRKRESGVRLAGAIVAIATIAALDSYVAARLAAAAVDSGTEASDDLSRDPAYEPPEPLKGIKGG